MRVSFVYKYDNVDKPIPVNLYNVRHIKMKFGEIRIIERDDFHYATYDKTRIVCDIDIQEE